MLRRHASVSASLAAAPSAAPAMVELVISTMTPPVAMSRSSFHSSSYRARPGVVTYRPPPTAAPQQRQHQPPHHSMRDSDEMGGGRGNSHDDDDDEGHRHASTATNTTATASFRQQHDGFSNPHPARAASAAADHHRPSRQDGDDRHRHSRGSSSSMDDVDMDEARVAVEDDGAETMMEAPGARHNRGRHDHRRHSGRREQREERGYEDDNSTYDATEPRGFSRRNHHRGRGGRGHGNHHQQQQEAASSSNARSRAVARKLRRDGPDAMTLRENIHGILSEMAPPATGAGGCSSVASTAAAPIPPVVIDLTLLDSTRTKNPRSTIGQDTRGGGDGQLAVIDETVAPQLWESSILLRSSLPARLEMGACVVGGSDAVRRIWKQHGVKPNVVYLPDGANEVPTWCQERATSSTSSPALVVRALGAAIRTELLSAEHSDGVAAEFPLPAHNPAPLTQLLEYPTSPEQRLRRVLVVHQVRVPGNLGSILRAAEQLQFDAIVLDRCCDPTSEKVLRESGGALYSSRLKVFLLSPSGVWRRFAEEYQQPRLLKASSESSSAMPVHDATTNNDSRDATQAPDAAGSPSNPRGAAAQGEFHQQTSHPSRQYIASAAELLQRAARAHGLTPFVLTPDQTADSAFELAREFHEHAADLKAASIGHGSAAVRPEADGTEAAATATADAAPGAMLIVGGESAGLDHLLREWDARLAAVADPNEDEDNEDHESEHAYDDDLDDEIVNETSSGSCLKGAIPRGGGAGVIDTEVNTHSIRQDDVSASSDIDDDETEVGENGHNDDDDDLSGAAVASVAYVPMCLRMDNPLVQSLNVAAAASAAMHHFRPAAAVEHARLRRRWKIAEGKAKIANSGGASSGLPSY